MTTLSLMRFDSRPDRTWIFLQMGRVPDLPGIPSPFVAVPGLRFSRLLGSGAGNGFGLRPNLGVYALLGHWTDRAAAERYFAEDAWFGQARRRSNEVATFYLDATMTHGQWGGERPFPDHRDAYDPARPVAVITRATIRTRKLIDFWRHVPRTSAAVYEHPARKLSVGIGEYPAFMQATFSLWTTGKAMMDFAYRDDHHREVIRLTRARNWYKEEMFTRFTVVDVVGSWGATDLTAFGQRPPAARGR